MAKLQQIDAALAQRVQWAMMQAGLDVRKLGRALDQEYGIGDGVECAVAWASGRRLLPFSGMSLADACNVDARWLSTGKPTPAGLSLAASLRKIRFAGPIMALAIAGSNLAEILQRLPQPHVCPGVCRYCGCTFENACPAGCEWLDSEQTFCSACWDSE